MPTHLNYEAFQNSIVTRLGGLNTPTQLVDIVPLPEVDADRKASRQDRPQITVAYLGSDYTGSGTQPTTFDIGEAQQEEMVNFHVIVESKKLYGSTEMYGILNKTRELLLGFSPAGCEKILFRKSQLEKKTDESGKATLGFVFILECVVKTYAFEIDDTTTYPQLTQVTHLPTI